MGETNKSILSLNNAFDLKKKMVFTLKVFKKPFGWVLFFHIGNKDFIVLCICFNVLENETKIC